MLLLILLLPEKSRVINSRNPKVFKSKGMSLTKERIDLLNFADSDTLGLEIEDLKNADGSPKGTKVMIRIVCESSPVVVVCSISVTLGCAIPKMKSANDEANESYSFCKTTKIANRIDKIL